MLIFNIKSFNPIEIFLIIFLILLPSSIVGYDSLNLTDKEIEYLNSKEYLTMVVDPNWKPFDFIDNGKHSGMGADYISLISERLGVEIRLIPTRNWVESLGIAKKGECDIISMLNITPEREKYLDFTDPFFTSQIVIISNERIWLTKGLDELAGKKVAVGQGYWLEENIRRDYPEIDLVPLEKPEDTLRLVANGQAYATVVTLIEALLIIRQEAFSDLRIIGQTSYENKLRLGVPKGNPILLQILQKSVHSLSEEESSRIFSKWASIKIDKPFNYSLLWKVSALVLLILSLFLYWNRKLSRLNNSLINIHKELESKNRTLKVLSTTDKLTGIFNRMKLDKILLNEIERSKRFLRPLSIILLDIDHFKSINDKLGHLEGDKILKITSKILSSNIREVDSVGRWGGEEFLIICPSTDIDGASILAESLRKKIEEQKLSLNCSYSGSFGIAQFIPGDNETSLVNRADKALYKAKNIGRNRVEKN